MSEVKQISARITKFVGYMYCVESDDGNEIQWLTGYQMPQELRKGEESIGTRGWLVYSTTPSSGYYQFVSRR